MKAQTGTLLRIFLSESERFERQPLYMAVVEELQRNGFHGATVLKGIEGFGARGKIRSARAVDFSADLPVLIEVIESDERIEAIVPRLKEMIPEGLLTLERVQLIALRRPPQ